MANFLRRANRGVILAIFVLVAFTIFYIVNSISVDSQKEEIQEVAFSYYDEVLQLNVDDKEFQSLTNHQTTENFEEKMDKYEAINGAYWVSKEYKSTNAMNFSATKSDLLASAMGGFDNTLPKGDVSAGEEASLSGYIYDVSSSIDGKAKVSPIGLSMVKVQFSVKNLYKLVGNGRYFNGVNMEKYGASLNGLMADKEYAETPTGESDEEIAVSDTKYSMSSDGTVVAYMKRENGEWKIALFNPKIYGMGQLTEIGDE